MPTVQLAQPGGGFITQELTDEEYKKHSGSAGFMTENQGPTSGIQTVPKPPYKPGQGGPINPPLTIDTPVSSPQFDTELGAADKATSDADLQSRLDAARNLSKQRLQEIRDIGKGKIGGAKGFLSKAGALGRSVSGASAESGIGVLGDITNKVNLALSEEQNRLSSEEAQINRDVKNEIQARLDKLNELKQQTFKNALDIMNDSRQERADARAAAQEGRLDRAEQRDIEERARKETVDTINFLLTNFGPEVIGKTTSADLAEWESDLGMPAGSLLAGFKLVEEEKLKNPEIQSSQFFTDPFTGDVTVGILYKNGTVKNIPVGSGIGTRLKSTGGGTGTGTGSGLTSTPDLTDKELNANLKSLGYSDAEIRLYRTAQQNTPNQSLDPKTFLNNLKARVKTSTTEDQTLTSAGFSTNEIDNIKINIGMGYYDDILSDASLSDTQKAAIKKVFANESQKATSAAETKEQKALLDAIKNAKAQNMSKEEAKKSALNAGWDTAYVDKLINEVYK